MFSAEDMIHMDRVEAKCSPSFSLENPLIKAKDQFSKNLVVPSWHTPFVLLPGGKIFSHSMAIKPRIIIIVAQLNPTTRTIKETTQTDLSCLYLLLPNCVIMRVVLLRLGGRSTSSKHTSTPAHGCAHLPTRI